MARHGGELLRATASVINYALQHGKPPRLHLDSFHQALRQKRATFVTLRRDGRSEEHTSELQSLMRTSYAVFCLKKKIPTHTIVYQLLHDYKTQRNTTTST